MRSPSFSVRARAAVEPHRGGHRTNTVSALTSCHDSACVQDTATGALLNTGRQTGVAAGGDRPRATCPHRPLRRFHSSHPFPPVPVGGTGGHTARPGSDGAGRTRHAPSERARRVDSAHDRPRTQKRAISRVLHVAATSPISPCSSGVQLPWQRSTTGRVIDEPPPKRWSH